MTPAVAIAKLAALGLPADKLVEAAAIIAAVVAAVHAPIEERRARDRARQAVRWERMGISQAEWERLRLEVFSRDGYRCSYCGSAAGTMTCDHVVAVANGGETVLSNLVTACGPCNFSKGARPVDEWRGQR